ncbi:MAG: allophanate hydrolase [Acidimicrobiia bacterium]
MTGSFTPLGPGPAGIAELRADLAAGATTPAAVVKRAYAALAQLESAVINFVPEETALALADRDLDGLPLGGVPFVIKDNIDVAGVATTAGCPSFSYLPSESATVVQRLVEAGAIPVAKTNLDQFATGLVGTRSPYGIPLNPFDRTRVPGGSSSGSAVAVACGAVPFALGTDTAGSGRVPAAFTGTVGLKPTRGWLSTKGVVPAVRTLDCVSIFALSVEDAWAVAVLAAAFDPADPFSRRRPAWHPLRSPGPRVGVGRGIDLASVLDLPSALAQAAGSAVIQEIEVAPLLEAGRLLYGGPAVAERFAAVGDFLAADPPGVDPTVREIILDANRWTASDAAVAGYELAHLRRVAEAIWEDIDVLVLPTVARHPTLAEVAADPVGVNAELGTYTTFANLLDLCAVAVPTGLRSGLPQGVCVLAPAWADALAGAVASQIHLATGGLRGVVGRPVADTGWAPPRTSGGIDLAVVGAHLAGQPLHHQLTELGAVFVAATTTTSDYRLYALPDTVPAKPGLVRVAAGTGRAIEVEVYRLDAAGFGRFVAEVAPPLCIGTVRLPSGPVAGFLCEPLAVEGAIDISEYGAWRAYRSVRPAHP